ncbi:MAG: helicase-related protein, partial [Patescibacteria group bacterium]
PGTYELENSGKPVEQLRRPKGVGVPTEASGVIQQIIRPTGLVDPEIVVRPIISSTKVRHPMSNFSEYPGQVKDFIAEADIVTKRGGRSMVTVLTKKMAEDLTAFLIEKKIKARYVHSDVKTIERIEILTNFRKGKFDVLVGVNLLREGLDLPEVELVGILDADKEGFLRSETSLIQTIGRAARNVLGRVILYADNATGSMERAIKTTNERRDRQIAYNKKHGITPKTIKTRIKDIVGDIVAARRRAVFDLAKMDSAAYAGTKASLIATKRKEMHEAANNLDFETAALLRDEIQELEKDKRKKVK